MILFNHRYESNRKNSFSFIVQILFGFTFIVNHSNLSFYKNVKSFPLRFILYKIVMDYLDSSFNSTL